MQLSSQKPSHKGTCLSAHLIEPLDLLFLVFAMPGEWAQLILQVLDLLAQLLGLCCQLFLVGLQERRVGKQGLSRRPGLPDPCPGSPSLSGTISGFSVVTWGEVGVFESPFVLLSRKRSLAE